VPAGIFPKLPEEGSLLLFRAKQGRGVTYPELLEKEKGEAEDWGKREFPGLTHEGLLVTTAAHVDPA
jgi:hypothetical protein